MESLLSKEEQSKIRIFFYLINSNKERSIQEIEKYSGLSYYKVSKLVDNLNDDVKYYYRSDFTLIDKSSRGSVFIKANSSFLFNLLIQNYCKNNMAFKLLDRILLKKEYSVTKFANDNFLSLSYAYSIVNKLDKFLNGYHLKLDENLCISGDELSIRNLFYSIYINIFRNEDYVFSNKLEMEAENLTRKIETHFKLANLSSQDRKKIKYYVTIGIIRMKGNYYLVDSIFTNTSYENQFTQDLQKRFALSEKTALTWYQEIKYFLEVENILLMSTTIINSELVSVAYAKTVRIIDRLDQQNLSFKNRINPDYGFFKMKNFIQDVFLIYSKRVDALFFVEQFYLIELFPDKVQLIHLLFDNSFDMFNSQNRYIIFIFLLILDELFENIVTSEIKLKLDLIGGSKYERLILSKLSLNSHSTIKLTTDHPDILITDRLKDFETSSDDCTQIVSWAYPPSINDWKKLQQFLGKQPPIK